MKGKTTTKKRQRYNKAIMVTLGEESAARVRQIAKAEERPVTFIARRFIEQGLENQESQDS